MTTFDLLVSVAALVAGEAFFALSEIALISANRARLRALAASGSGAAGCAVALLERPEKLLATALTGTNLCLVSASFAANEAASRVLGEARSAWAIAVLAPIILMFGEFLPKAFARRHADRIAALVAYPIRVAMLLLSPVVGLAGGFSRIFMSAVTRGNGPHPFVTREELRAVLRAERRAAFDPEEASLIHRLLGMAGSRVREVMTPLPDVISISASVTHAKAAETIRRHGFSRIPVYQDRTDNIVGVVHTMDLIVAGGEDPGIAPYLRRPLYVPESGKLQQLLDEFRRRGQELAVVVDEYGAASGIVTLEDVLEELVGDILDEFDRPRIESLEREASGAFIAQGSIHLSDLSEKLGVKFPRAGYDTLSGFMAHRLQRIPKEGDRVLFEGLTLSVLEAGGRRARRVRIVTT